MKYLVMEVHRSYAVVLDEEGRFLIAANLNYELGQTVTDPVLMNQYQAVEYETSQPVHRKKNKNKNKGSAFNTHWFAGLIVAAAALFLIFFGYRSYQNNTVAFSSVYLAINPEVRMELNRKGNVIDLEGENADGQALIKDYQLENKDKTVVTNDLIDRAIEMGFLEEGDVVNIIIDTPDQKMFEKYGVEFRRTIREHLDGRLSVTIEIMTKEEKEKKQQEENKKDQQDKEKARSQAPKDDDDDDDDQQTAGQSKAPATQAPRTQAPRTQAPQTQAPRTQAPRTQAPRTQAPQTRAPAPRPAPVPRYEYDDDDDDYDDDYDDDDDDDD